MTTPNASRTARARVRDELTREIKQAARRQLSEYGGGALSLRAVARELGMASSAIYRYFPGRDELLTALIVDAYDSVGEEAERREAEVPRGDHLGRWLATAEATRGWALAHRNEYELIFGSPVPGYAAPQVTIDPAARIPLLLVGIVRDAVAAGGAAMPDRPGATASELPDSVRSDMTALATLLDLDVPQELVAEMLDAWTTLIGTINFELFGHLVGSVTDYDAYFRYQMSRAGGWLGLA